MAKQKVTITVDPTKVGVVRRLTGAASTSAAIDLALGELIRSEHLRRDVAAYSGRPATDDEIALSRTNPPWDDLADDLDWAALYEKG
ncbi:MAG: hypothetical protein ACRDRT_09895 [Pseudonocardiaceae bacterium]